LPVSVFENPDKSRLNRWEENVLYIEYLLFAIYYH